MKYLLPILLFMGCGVPEKIEVEHTVNVQMLEPYLFAYCETQHADPAAIQSCVTYHLGKLLSSL